jgi:hypothetical protein
MTRSIVTEPTTATVAGILLEGSFFMLFNDTRSRQEASRPNAWNDGVMEYWKNGFFIGKRI